MYLEYRDRFIKQLQYLNLDYHINYIHKVDNDEAAVQWTNSFKVDGLASKWLACLQKPKLLLSTLLLHKKPIISIDVDSFLSGTPVFNDYDFDVGFLNRREVLQLNRGKTEYLRCNLNENALNAIPITDGLIMFNYTQQSIDFLKRWVYICNFPDFISLPDHERLLMLVYDIYALNNVHCKFKYLNDEFKDIFVDCVNGSRLL